MQFDEALNCFQNVIDSRQSLEPNFVSFSPELSIFHVLYRAKDECILAVAVNNYSVCCLHLKRNLAAVSSMEKLIAEDPVRFLSDSMVFNLCTMYDLSFSTEVSTSKKKALQKLAVRFGINEPLLHWRSFRLN